jgi:predicted nucleotidyltransferase
MKILLESWGEYINEIEIDKSRFQINDTLNPRFWKNKKLNPLIGDRLKAISEDFYGYLGVDYEIEDIILTGSNANYNWNDLSDLDVHIIINYKKTGEDMDFLNELFTAKRSNWNRVHNILMKGHEVEMYVQDEDEPHIATGVYSLLNDEWNVEPQHRAQPEIDYATVEKKAGNIEDEIGQISKMYDEGKYEDVLECTEVLKGKIRKMRRAGLYSAGEFSAENIAFKVLRNSGNLARLSKLRNKAYDALMSLEKEDAPKIKINISEVWRRYCESNNL